MAEFKIQDDNTGMMVTVKGNQPPPPEALPEIFAAAQKGAVDKLSSGEFNVGSDFVPLDKDAKNRRIRSLSAQALGMSEEEVDVHSGMGILGQNQAQHAAD